MTPIQQKIEEYREWLQEEVRVRKGAINMGAAMMGMGYEDALQKLDTMFPVEHTSEEPTMSDLIMDTVDIPVDDGPIEEEWARKDIKQELGIADETDNIYPKH